VGAGGKRLWGGVIWWVVGGAGRELGRGVRVDEGCEGGCGMGRRFGMHRLRYMGLGGSGGGEVPRVEERR